MEKFKYSDFEIVLSKEDIILDNSLIQREIIYKDYTNIGNIKYLKDIIGYEDDTITQIQATCWPDYLVPEEEIGYKMMDILIMFVEQFREKHPDSPIIVHCRYNSLLLILIYNIVLD